MIDVFTAAVAAHIRDATFVVVAGSDARVAVGTSVRLAGGHQVWQRSKATFWRRWHAIEWVCLVDLVRLVGAIGGVGRRIVFLLLEIVH